MTKTEQTDAATAEIIDIHKEIEAGTFVSRKELKERIGALIISLQVSHSIEDVRNQRIAELEGRLQYKFHVKLETDLAVANERIASITRYTNSRLCHLETSLNTANERLRGCRGALVDISRVSGTSQLQFNIATKALAATEEEKPNAS